MGVPYMVKTIFRKIYTLFHVKRAFMMWIVRRKWFKYVPDKLALKIKYQNVFYKKLNLKNPKTFTEKLQWLKLYDRKPEYTMMVDKYRVKEWVSKKIGSKYVIPTLGVWKSFAEIDFDNLPNQFVLKCTHDSGSVVLCKDKNNFDKENAAKVLGEALKENFYYRSREWPYKNVIPGIIAEKMIIDLSNNDLPDYKVMCFGGVPHFIQYHSGRNDTDNAGINNHTQDYYDAKWNKLQVYDIGLENSNKKVSPPIYLQEMLELSAQLSADIPEVRVDWYYADNQLYFGEMTFFDAGGYCKYVPESFDKELGDLVHLPPKNS